MPSLNSNCGTTWVGRGHTQTLVKLLSLTL
jgi:hypothetical protein